MTPETETSAPTTLPFGAAFDRLQQIAAQLGTDEAIEPERLIALLREGKGLERALREHLDRVEQEVRAIEDGDGAASFRIATGEQAAAPPLAPAPVAPAAPSAPPESAPRATEPEPEPLPPVAAAPTPTPTAAPPAPPAPPGLFADDDIPF
ncbi:hypothetical protein [Patulibacter defluvii]|uniref:hypothetical protein n=1 Tax=Patulibacter defluvii TaxID=3095358 RepID=UPI002A7653D9|nr:hypothetical protein [Patulibacter sp. DM4]